MNILHLCNRPARGTQAQTVTDYLDAFENYSRHTVSEVSMLCDFPSRVDLARFDAIIIHYSLSIGVMLNHYLSKELQEKLKAYQGLKVVFLQDEYRNLRQVWNNINLLGVDLLFTCVPDTEISKVYPKEKVPNTVVVNVLTGYVPESLLKIKVADISARTIDIGYRTRKMPACSRPD